MLKDVKSKVEKLQALVDDREDPDWKTMALGMISKLQDPMNGLVVSWNDWWLAHNALGHTGDWDPAGNPHHMVRSEVNDIYKAMTKIRARTMRLWERKVRRRRLTLRMGSAPANAIAARQILVASTYLIIEEALLTARPSLIGSSTSVSTCWPCSLPVRGAGSIPSHSLPHHSHSLTPE